MSTVFIADAYAHTSIGRNLDTTFQALLEKRSGIKKVKRFDTSNLRSDYAAIIDEIVEPDYRSLFLNLTDSILNQINDIPENCMVITATTKACIDLFEKHEEKQHSFDKNLLPSNIAGYISQKLGLQNTGLNISSACASSTIAIIKGSQMILNDRTDAVLIFCADIISKFVFSGFSALNALSDAPSKPFDLKRKGLTLGEGGAAILLVSKKYAKNNNLKCSASIKGFGIASDAAHITAPARDGRGLISAVKNALKTSGVSPDQISAVNAHGTGTVYNDLMEITAFKNIFVHHDIPVNSIKGSIGHTLGGAGGIEAAIATLILKEKILPGTCGFSVPEKGAEKMISRENIEFSGDLLLSTNSGFGGTNAALILKKEICL